MDTATERLEVVSGTRRSAGAGRRVGPDRLSVMLLALAAFMAILALLASQLRATTGHGYTVARAAVLRRVYLTKVIDSGPGPASGPLVTQSVSSSGSYSAPTQVTTHTS